jgi:nicotinamidase-related amidase
MTSEDTVLVVVDVQGRLAEAMDGSAELLTALDRLIRGARRLEVPVIVTEQIPSKLGPTRPELAGAIEGLTPISKVAFSCAGERAFMDALAALRRPRVALCGIEAHVCVYQTARDLLAAGYAVEVVADAVSSRSARNREITLARMRDEGAHWTSVEQALMDWLGSAADPRFRDMLALIK